MKGRVFVMVAIAAVVLYALTRPAPGPGRGIQPDDPDLACDPNYRVCFTPAANINKTIRQPVMLSDLAVNSRQDRPVSGSIPGRYVNMLHYPGNMYRIEDRTSMNGGLAGGYVNNCMYWTIDDDRCNKGEIKFALQGCTLSTYQWRPDRVSYACSNGLQYAFYPLTQYTYVGRISIRSASAVSATGPSGTHEWGTWNGHAGWKVTTSTHDFYVLFDVAPTPVGTIPNAVTGVTFPTTYDGTVLITIGSAGLAEAPTLFTDPSTAIANAAQVYRDYFRSMAAPTLETTDWGKERYYRGLNTHLYTMLKAGPDQTTNLWGTYLVVSPGGYYDGVWIWDSFFQAWAAIQACTTPACVQTYMDSLRVLKVNQYPGGQFPRQVNPTIRKSVGEFQAPGGWSFAVDQADQKFGSTTLSIEFFGALDAFHTYIATTRDSDGDGVFEWDGADTGWDSSPRWLIGSGDINAIDLQAWMILDAEALRNIAQRIGNTSAATQYEQQRQAYIADIQPYCSPGPYCYDKTRGLAVTSTILTPATYFLLMAGALTQAQAEAMLPALHDPALLGPGPGDIGILPSVSRSDTNYDAEGGIRTWGGPYWVNLAIVTYVGLKRYGLDTEVEYVRTRMQNLLQQGGVDQESYISDGAVVGGTPYGGFNNPYYGWTASGVMIFSTPHAFSFMPVSGCTDGQTRSCGNATGLCTTGIETCAAGVWGACTGNMGTMEICGNGIDEDCNGSDLVCPPSCTTDADGDGYRAEAACAPNQDCNDANATIHPGAAETCDNVDEDCDTYVDENLVTTLGCDQTGACAGATTVCTAGLWGACTLVPGQLAETCDGLDNDCDSQTDENLWRGCPISQQGICADSTQACASGIWGYGGIGGACTIMPEAEVCINGIDEDCDGVLDNGCACMDGQTLPCGTDTGVCVAGTQTCTGGQWGGCAGSVPPTAEACDGLDNDCDNSTDDGIPQTSCGTDIGECAPGVTVCANGVSMCFGAVGPEVEQCNGVDDNCNGQADENLIRSCVIGLNTGTQNCTDGVYGACQLSGYVTATCANQSANQCTLDWLGGHPTSATCQAECQCSPNWMCSGWSAYDHGTCGIRTQTCVDRNNCLNGTRPATLQSVACPGTVCGNGVAEAGEVCDQADLRNATCISVDDRHASGAIGCLANCSGYATDGCLKGAPVLKYYGCAATGACVAMPDGQWYSPDCGSRCGSIQSPNPYDAIGGGILVVLVLILILMWPRRGRRRSR